MEFLTFRRLKNAGCISGGNGVGEVRGYGAGG